MPLQRPRQAGFQLLEQRVEVARPDRHAADHLARPSRRSAAGPRRCRAGRGRSAARSCSATVRALSSSREAMPSSTLRIAGADSVKRSGRRVPCAWRAASMLAIGASSRGAGRAAMPCSRLRERLQPVHLGRSTQHLPQVPDDADQQHADDQAVQQRIGAEGRSQLPREQRRRRTHHRQEAQHRGSGRSSGRVIGVRLWRPAAGAGGLAAMRTSTRSCPRRRPRGPSARGCRCGWRACPRPPAPRAPPGRGPA